MGVDSPKIARPEGGSFPSTDKNMTMNRGHAAAVSVLGTMDDLIKTDEMLRLSISLNKEPEYWANGMFNPEELQIALKKYVVVMKELIRHLKAHKTEESL